ncbi:MAG: hypothetical protein Q4E33_01005 [Erysipelotrichaceae bacterium]|nr:hypothetical protein [Erysipelotrichaceae bacterium]
MKIYCEQCKQEITGYVDKNIDDYKVGQVLCPNCNHKQSRYISESDLLLYFAISELFYLIISVVTMLMFTLAKSIVAMIAIAIPLLIIAYFIQREIMHRIYINAYGKEEFKNHIFKEDGESIRKTISWQYMLFFAIAITFVTMEDVRIWFGILCVIAVILSFLKYWLCLKKEKQELNK